MKASSLVSRLWPSESPSVFGFSLVSRLRFLILSLLRMCASKKERTDTTLKFDRHLQAGQDLFSVFDKNSNVASSLVVIHWRIVYVRHHQSQHTLYMHAMSPEFSTTYAARNASTLYKATHLRTYKNHLCTAESRRVRMYLCTFISTCNLLIDHIRTAITAYAIQVSSL